MKASTMGQYILIKSSHYILCVWNMYVILFLSYNKAHEYGKKISE